MRFEKAMSLLNGGIPVTRSSMGDYYFTKHFELNDRGGGSYTTEFFIELCRKTETSFETVWSNYSFSYPEIIAEDWEVYE